MAASEEMIPEDLKHRLARYYGHTPDEIQRAWERALGNCASPDIHGKPHRGGALGNIESCTPPGEPSGWS